MSEGGYRKYQGFFNASPLLVIEWHDTETDAVGWLVINSLKGGAAGGGTRMRKGEPITDNYRVEDDYQKFREECIFLAKTMEIKFCVSRPLIGGAKSVIRFDPKSDKKKEVLQRWYQAISPYLQQCYGTGGDLNVNEGDEVIPLVNEIGIKHPQNGVVAGHFKHKGADCQRILEQLKAGGEIPVYLDGLSEPFTVANMITGYGLSKALEYFYAARNDSLRGKRVIVEGFGEVGGASAYYLMQAGAKVVGIITKPNENYRWAVNSDGLDVGRLLAHRENKNLPSNDPDCRTEPDADKFWATKADIFVPAAGSHLTKRETLNRLHSAEVKVIACGANNPFGPFEDVSETQPQADTSDRSDKRFAVFFEKVLKTQQQADREFAVIPDFIANCGTARMFAYLMEEQRPVLNYSLMCEDVAQTVRQAMDKLLGGFDGNTGLLNRAYSIFIQ